MKSFSQALGHVPDGLAATRMGVPEGKTPAVPGACKRYMGRVVAMHGIRQGWLHAWCTSMDIGMLCVTYTSSQYTGNQMQKEFCACGGAPQGRRTSRILPQERCTTHQTE